MGFLATVEKGGIVPVVVIDRAEDAVDAARALMEGGISIMEITLRTAAGPKAIRLVAAEVPEMLVGAGTVLNVEQMKEALSAGARFIVCPGTDEKMLAYAQENQVTLLPGVIGPSEILCGLKYGIEVFKFFPSEAYGGVKTLKALSGPFGSIRFVPTGGVSLENLRQYLECGAVAAVGGSWMITSGMLRERAFEKIAEASRQAVKLCREIRG